MISSRSSTAIEVFRQATANFADRNIREALDLFDKAQRLGFDEDSCSGYRWQCRMLLGEFDRAWEESEASIRRGVPDSKRLWDGLPFAGKRVIIRCLHGYGDAIQFLRYAPLVRASAARVIVETHPEMVSLVQKIPGVDRAITWEGPPCPDRDDWNQQIEVMELPRAFRTSLHTIPRTLPYVAIRRSGVSRLPDHGRPKIGLIWAASSWNPLRSLPLVELGPVLELRDFSFYSFQRGPERAELARSSHSGRICDTAVQSPDIIDTAADLLEIDLLITVDTMAAHLAGALGRPVWVLLPFEADWRWMLGREDSPWYPTMRLFRQPTRDGGWAGVVDRLRQELTTTYGEPRGMLPNVLTMFG